MSEGKKIDPGFKRNIIFIFGSLAIISAIVFMMYSSNKKKQERVVAEPSAVQVGSSALTAENNTPPTGLSDKLLATEKEKGDAAKANGNSFIGSSIDQRVTDIDKEKRRVAEEERERQLANKNQPNGGVQNGVAYTNTAGVEQPGYPKANNGNGSQSLNFQQERFLQYGLIANGEVDRTSKDLHTVSEIEIVAVASKNQTSLAGQVAASASGVPQTIQDAIDGKALLGKMGERYYAQLKAGVKSDLTSPVIATIISGPARGTRISGSFARAHDGTMLLTFNKLAVGDGRSLSLSAVAIDQNTGIAAVDGDVNHMWVERFLLPMTAAVLGQYGQLQAQNGTTTTLPANALSGQQVVRNLTPAQMRAGALGAGATQAQTMLNAEAAQAKPTTTLDQNMIIMIMLTDDLFITNKGIVKDGSISKEN
jgi:hypothetical protein